MREDVIDEMPHFLPAHPIDFKNMWAEPRFYVTTIHGQRAYLASGDWVITEVDGVHHYPCKPDIFAATYELAEG